MERLGRKLFTLTVSTCCAMHVCLSICLCMTYSTYAHIYYVGTYMRTDSYQHLASHAYELRMYVHSIEFSMFQNLMPKGFCQECTTHSSLPHDCVSQKMAEHVC